MRAYGDIVRSTSACIHFVEEHQCTDDLIEIRRELEAREIDVFYFDCKFIDEKQNKLCELLADTLQLEHAPYFEENWIKLLDDLISLSRKKNGLVIVLDNASIIFSKNRTEFFDLIESFLIQFHHWLHANKPCHLCFQMIDDRRILEIFGSNRMQEKRD